LSEPDHGQGLSILVVDDNPDDLTAFSRTVRSKPWRVDTASSGQGGLEKALRGSYDLIVLDYNLGDMTGTEVLLRLKEAGVTAPVLIQSGFGGDFIVARALTLGAEGFIPKDSPRYEEEVLSKVSAAVQRSQVTGRQARADRREGVQEVEAVLDDLMERGRGRLAAVGFASPDGFRVSTRFRGAKTLTPETICAMVASMTSTAKFLGEGLGLPALRLITTDFRGGRLYAAPVAGFGVLFGAVAEGADAQVTVQAELEFAARELATLLSTMSQTEQYSY
jgi:CheY-like chemotaxis protein